MRVCTLDPECEPGALTRSPGGPGPSGIMLANTLVKPLPNPNPNPRTPTPQPRPPTSEQDEGLFDDEIVPVKNSSKDHWVTKDNGIRVSTDEQVCICVGLGVPLRGSRCGWGRWV